MRAYERDSHKHANTSIYERAYETILISTLLIQAYMSVLMRGILISTLIEAYMSVLIRVATKNTFCNLFSPNLLKCSFDV